MERPGLVRAVPQIELADTLFQRLLDFGILRGALFGRVGQIGE
ncbi:MAG: hypothetical protein ABR601_06885 [Parasphingopyxis sp.]